jgi:hypothetical protein
MIQAFRKWKFRRFSETCTPRELLWRLATLDDESCNVIKSDLRRRYDGLGIQEIIWVAARELPGDHPGWSILALFAEHAVGNINTVEDLGRLKRRIEAGEFVGMLPFVVIVWIECRLRARTFSNEHTTFSPEWKGIMLRAVESPAVPDTVAKSLLPGKIDMILAMMIARHERMTFSQIFDSGLNPR